MKIQHITGNLSNGLLHLTWLILCDAKNISIQIASNSEFTEQLRQFILPPVESCILTVGKGDWFVRLGAWIGDTITGVIQWSGIVGPFSEPELTLDIPSIPTSPLTTVDGYSIQKGYRINTHTSVAQYVILEHSKGPDFMASQTATHYAYDWGRGFIDCMGLSFESSYYIRISLPSECPDIFVHRSIRRYSQGVVLENRTASKPIEFATNAELNAYHTDEILLRKVKDTKGYVFKTHAEYIQYKLALAKLRG